MPHIYIYITWCGAVEINYKLIDDVQQTLYNLGARKLALSGLGLIGCTPYEVATHGTNGGPCVDNINNAVQLFNTGLRLLVNDLNANFPNTKSIYIDNYGIGIQLSTNASSGKYIPFFFLAINIFYLKEETILLYI